jgi:hypothetical protein
MQLATFTISKFVQFSFETIIFFYQIVYLSIIVLLFLLMMKDLWCLHVKNDSLKSKNLTFFHLETFNNILNKYALFRCMTYLQITMYEKKWIMKKKPKDLFLLKLNVFTLTHCVFHDFKSAQRINFTSSERYFGCNFKQSYNCCM